MGMGVRKSGSTVMAAAILTVLVLSGCGSGPTSSSGLATARIAQPTHPEITPGTTGADTSTSPSPVPSSRPTAPPATVTVVVARETFSDGQASLNPPTPAQVPADPTAAWNRIAATLPGNPCGDAKAETVQYGLVTFGEAFPGPAYYKAPEWVLRCVDSPAPLVVPGPPYPSGHPSPTPAVQSTPLLEDFISVFDARTGKLLFGWNEHAS